MAEKKTWTILLYLSTDNSLSEEGVYILKELKKVGTPDVNVFAQFDPVGRGNPTRRFLINRADADGKLGEEDVFEPQVNLGETDMSDPATLREFLVKGITAFPATTNFMLILSGHGGGINQGFFLRDEERRLSDIPSSFPLPDLKKEVFGHDDVLGALKRRKIDILGFDSCLMSMVEVCYQLHDCESLEYVVASEGFSLNAGWPYDRIVYRMANKNIEPLDLARFIVEDHAKFYKDYHLGGLSVDLSVVELNLIPTLTEQIRKLAVALIRKFKEESEFANEDKETEEATDPATHEKRKFFYKLDGRPFQDSILLSHWAAQSYNGEQSIDLFDFCYLLEKRAYLFEPRGFEENNDSIYKLCQQVRDAIKHAVRFTCDDGAAFQFSYGVSISLPWSRVNTPPNYPTLRFVRDVPEWFDFINLYADATQRLPQRRAEAALRSTPPYSKGPEGRILSMRNPPVHFVEQKCEAPKTR